ncbi:MAG: hypothetical protein ABGY75_04245 [Gemmataceae bacterium]
MIRLRVHHRKPLAQFLNLYWQSRDLRRQIEGKARTTAGIYKISQRDVAEFNVPISPLAEQRRIVARIEELFAELDAAVEELERVRANLKRYRAAVLKAAVTGDLTADWRAAHPNAEPASVLLERILTDRRAKWEADQLAKFATDRKTPPKNWQAKYADPSKPDTSKLPPLPASWCWGTVEQLITYLRNGYFESPRDLSSGVKLLRINAVRPMQVSLDEHRYLPPSDALNDYLIRDGDLLFTRYNGSVDLLGVAGLVRGCTEPIVHPDKLIRVIAALPYPLPNFLEIACNSGASRKHMVSRCRTSAGQTGISGTDVREMPIPLPPLAEQEAIVLEVEARLSDVTAAEAVVNANLTRTARLRQSILKEAFAGRLVPQDPADEPAAVLLERIRAAKPTATPAKTPRGRKVATEVNEAVVDVLAFAVPTATEVGSLNRTKIQKFTAVLQTHHGVEIVARFLQAPFGPYAPELEAMEPVCGERGFFTTEKQPKGDEGFEVAYVPGENAEVGRSAGVKRLGANTADAEKLLRLIRSMTTDEAELFATVYAVWNDSLIDGKPVGDDAIIAGVYAWNVQKRKFTPAAITAMIARIRTEGYEPTGRGKHTEPTKPKRGRKKATPSE